MPAFKIDFVDGRSETIDADCCNLEKLPGWVVFYKDGVVKDVLSAGSMKRPPRAHGSTMLEPRNHMTTSAKNGKTTTMTLRVN